MSRRYDQPEPGEWIRPTPKGYRMACCDCGLVHRIDFRAIKDVNKTNGVEVPRVHPEFRVYRDGRATANVRRGMKRRAKP